MQEIITTPEFKRKVTKVIIECRRHGQKENDEKKDNRKKLLTPTGRKQAVDKGKEFHPQSRVSVAVGSPQERTQETAAHMMLADEEKISVNDTLEKMQASIAEELKVGEKIIEDERLDFGFDGPIGEEVNAEYKKIICSSF